MPMYPRAYPRRFPLRASVGADMPIAATPIGTIPASITNGLVAPPLQPFNPFTNPYATPFFTVAPPSDVAPPLLISSLQVGNPSVDFGNGYRLGLEDVRRARTGATVTMGAWVITAGPQYLAGYQTGVAAAGGRIVPSRWGGPSQIVVDAAAGGPSPSYPRGGTPSPY